MKNYIKPSIDISNFTIANVDVCASMYNGEGPSVKANTDGLPNGIGNGIVNGLNGLTNGLTK